MEELADSGRVRQIGVCNFGTSLLRDLLSYARIRPAVLQVELHPFLTQEKLLRFCREESIAVTAFSPLGAPSYFSLKMAQPEESVIGTEAVRDSEMKTLSGMNRNRRFNDPGDFCEAAFGRFFPIYE